MKYLKTITCAFVGMVFLASCGMPPICKSYSPNEIDWNGYNSVCTFANYFSGYEQTIYDHIGDTVRVYGCTHYKYYGYTESMLDSSYVLTDLYDDTDGSRIMYIKNEIELAVPPSYYFKRLYVTGTVVYDEGIGCIKGTGLKLISIDTIPQNVMP